MKYLETLKKRDIWLPVTLWYWGAEEYKSPDWAETIDEEGLSISDHIFRRALEINEDAAVPTWANWLVAHQDNRANDPREIDGSIREYTSRWLSRRAWEAGHFRASGTPAIFVNRFFRLEDGARNIGEFHNPAEFTARWIAENAQTTIQKD